MTDNPLINEYSGNFGEVPFDRIRFEHYLPAIEYGLKKAYENIKNIKNNSEEPDFKNSIEALEFVSDDLDKAASVYFNLYSLHSDAEFKTLAETISPKLAKFTSDLFTDAGLFDRVKKVYDKKETSGLNPEELRLLKDTYKHFTRNGALLGEEDKQKLQKINEELSLLSPRFSKNTLGATNKFSLHITDEKRISGIPENALKGAKYAAEQKGHKEGWLFTLQFPSYRPVMQYADDRELRKEMSLAFGQKNLAGEFDNREIILKTIKLRKERANLLGFETHAHYILENRMAGTPEKVMNFLDSIFEVSYPAAVSELEEVSALAKTLDGIEEMQIWDMGYYSEKLKQKKFDFDSEELRPYLKAENVISGVFTLAAKLYGLNFEEISTVPVYFDEVKTYKVTDSNNRYMGLLYVDLYPRETKRDGAWMNTFMPQGLAKDGEVKRPHVLICGNLTPSTPDSPALLSFDDARTIFHEFGHALHALLSDVTYRSLASPDVYWDFVELPSQIMENWLFEKETLALFAEHYETGEIMPGELIEKVKKAQSFNAGCSNSFYLGMSYLDMLWHLTRPEEIRDVESFEDKVIDKTRLLPKTPGNRSTSFGHIFAGGYSAGYYSYKWAEVLDADAFELFKEKGIFNRETADLFREEILSKGNTADPMELYIKFRGAEPDNKALLRRDGLIK